MARRLGEPVAVVFGETDETVVKTLAEYGATRVLFIADPAFTDYLVAPKAEEPEPEAAAAAPAGTAEPEVIKKGKTEKEEEKPEAKK